MTGVVERDRIGSITHTVLQEYFSGRMGRPLRADDVDEPVMEALVSGAFEGEFGPDPTGRPYLVRRQLLRRMKEFLRHYQLPLIRRQNIIITALESTLSCTVAGFRITGRLDRVETRDGVLHVVDYKTGSSTPALRFRLSSFDVATRDTWSKSIGSLQLPIYLLLLAETTGLDPAGMQAAYLDLGRNRLDEGAEVFFCEENQDRGEKFAVAKDVVLYLLSEIADPRIPFKPTSEPDKACPYCEFRYICGTQWAGGKR